MTRPLCKAEGRWLFWRTMAKNLRQFGGWDKKQMARARRRFLKRLTRQERS